MIESHDIVYRVDGGKKLGYGHIFRSITIANDLKKKFKIKFLIIKEKTGFNFLKKKIKNIKFINIQNEYLEILKLKPRLVIFDTLSLKKKVLQKLHKKNIKIIVFEDLYNKSLNFSNFIINSIISGPKNKKVKIKNGYKLQGSNYKIIHKFKKSVLKQEKSNTFTISLGGGELKKGVLIKIFNKFYPILNKLKIKINIILGDGVSKKTENYFDKARTKYKSLKIYKNKNNIYDILSKSKFLLSAGGGTMYEAALFNVVLFIYPLRKHQEDNSKFLQKCGYGKIIKSLNTIYLTKLFQKTIQNKKYVINQIRNGKKILPYKNNRKTMNVISGCLKNN